MKSSSLTGFTLVELLISISIFTLITTVSVFNYSAFNSSVGLTNLAYEIALSVRQAQFYGITVKQSTTSGNFDSGYGVHFEKDSASYTLFEDRDVDHIYDGTSEDLERYTIQKGNRISKLCTHTTVLACDLDSLDLTFVRPNPETFIARNGLTSSLYTSQKAIVCLASPKGEVRKVVVEATGQISVSTAATECN